MSISRDEVLRIADLAHLELAEDAIERVTRELGIILGFAEALPAVDEADPASLGATPLRADEVARGLEPGEATRPAPGAERGLFKVPPAISDPS